MRGRISKYLVFLNTKKRRQLERVVRRRSVQSWRVQRAQIILVSNGGKSIESVCNALTLDRQVVRRWRKRFLEGGMDALQDKPKTGRPEEIDEKIWRKTATLIVQSPTKFGIEQGRWTVRLMRDYLWEKYSWEVSRSAINRFLKKMALKPHRIKYWLNPADPDFDEKALKICEIYLNPPKGKTVLSIDEKPGVQALSRKYPDIQIRSGTVRRVEFEYRRNGTRNIFAAFNIRTGQVVAQVTKRRKTEDVVKFLDLLASVYRKHPVMIITDNISTRRSPGTREWMAAHPRFSFVFTPKHGSWLNQVEIWFSILTSQCLKNRSFTSTRKLANAIMRWVKRWNEELAHPFQWTFTGKVLHA